MFKFKNSYFEIFQIQKQITLKNCSNYKMFRSKKFQTKKCSNFRFLKLYFFKIEKMFNFKYVHVRKNVQV
jgi:hypothetical protein